MGAQYERFYNVCSDVELTSLFKNSLCEEFQLLKTSQINLERKVKNSRKTFPRSHERRTRWISKLNYFNDGSSIAHKS